MSGLALLLLVFFSVGAIKCLKIDVLQGNTVERRFTDGNAYFEDRSYMIPRYRSDGIKGYLVYPVPRNACSNVEEAENNMSIAYLTEYMECPSSSIINLKNAHYMAVVAFTKNLSFVLEKILFSQAIITDLVTRKYLVDTVLEDDNHSNWQILIWDDTFANLEKLFIIFASTLMGAVILAVVVFCTILFCRLLILRMRTRGLSRLQVRALPKRKYHKVKETAESCSICLEEFKEGETIRVLPCEHVFHPKCVDEWLQRWNRTCPLCKSTVKRKKGLKARNHPSSTEDETSHLIPHEEPAPTVERETGRPIGSYGATGYTAPDGECRCHRRNASGASSHASGSVVGRNSKRHPIQVTAAEIEMSWESEDTEGRRSPYSPIFHTPLQSDDNLTARSFTTANDSESTGVGNVAV